jgi:tetratricopeptide (TPR) repeat protein
MTRAACPLLLVAALAASARAADDAVTAAYLDGLDALSAGAYADADKAFTRALAADEEYAPAYAARGVARTLAEDFPKAVADFERATRLAPDNDWEARGWLVVARRMGGDMQANYTPGLAPRADTEYSLALGEMATNYYSSRYQREVYDRRQQRMVPAAGPDKSAFPAVARYFVDRHRLRAGATPKLLAARLQTKLQQRQYAAALTDLRPLLAAAPNDPDLLSAQAQCLLGVGDVATARALFTRLLTVDPARADAYLGRARAAAAAGDALRTSKDLAAANRLDPKAAAAATDIPRILMANTGGGDPQSLYAQLEAQAKATPPAPPEKLRDTAAALVRAQGQRRLRYDEAYQERLTALEDARRARPNDPDRLVAVGRFLYDEANVMEDRVEPRRDPLPYRLQSPGDAERELARAEECAAAALKAAPRHVGALTLEAQLKVAAYRFADAEPLVQQALAVKPDDPALLELMAELLETAARRRSNAAAELREVRMWTSRRLDEYPPADYIYVRRPSQAELERADALDREAARLTRQATDTIGQAAKRNAGTYMGYYFQAVLARVQHDPQAAKAAMAAALKLQPTFERGWFQLAGICTELGQGDEAVAARATATNLTQTTAAAWLSAAWFKIPHTQYKTGREALAQALKLDPADPRVPAYLAVIDHATDKPADALAHFRMAQAISDAILLTHGRTPPAPRTDAAPPPALNPTPLPLDDAGLPIILRLREGGLALEQGDAAAAARAFDGALALFKAMGDVPEQDLLPAALLPNPALPGGTVPTPETVGVVRARAAAGVQYAAWAMAGRDPQDASRAGATYRRLLVDDTSEVTFPGAVDALANLGLAQLYLRRGQFAEAGQAIQKAVGVPQAFYQEMRQTEETIQARRPRTAEEAEDDARGKAAMNQVRQMFLQQRNALDEQLRQSNLSANRRALLQQQRDAIDAQLRDLSAP